MPTICTVYLNGHISWGMHANHSMMFSSNTHCRGRQANEHRPAFFSYCYWISHVSKANGEWTKGKYETIMCLIWKSNPHSVCLETFWLSDKLKIAGVVAFFFHIFLWKQSATLHLYLITSCDRNSARFCSHSLGGIASLRGGMVWSFFNSRHFDLKVNK